MSSTLPFYVHGSSTDFDVHWKQSSMDTEAMCVSLLKYAGFETASHYVAQATLELQIFLPLPSKH